LFAPDDLWERIVRDPGLARLLFNFIARTADTNEQRQFDVLLIERQRPDRTFGQVQAELAKP
jgi:hypothetical protein